MPRPNYETAIVLVALLLLFAWLEGRDAPERRPCPTAEALRACGGGQALEGIDTHAAHCCREFLKKEKP